MWMYIGAIVVGAALMYVVRILSTSEGSQYEDNTFDAFIDTSINSASVNKQASNQDKYFSSYCDPGFPVLIVYGTEYGFSEEIAMNLFDRIEVFPSKEESFCWQPRLVNARDYECVDFKKEKIVLVVISTAGDGVPPSDARPFYNNIMDLSAKTCDHMYFSVLAMGDSNYPHYCRIGRTLDKRFEELGAQRMASRADIDQEDWSSINNWIDRVLEGLRERQKHMNPWMDYLEPRIKSSGSGFDRSHPFMATLKVKYDLTRYSSLEDKESIHCEFDLTGSNLAWTSGDALGIYPTNDPEEVDRLLKVIGCTGSERVPVPKWAYQPQPDGEINLREALEKYYDLKTVRLELLCHLKDKIADNRMEHFMEDRNHKALSDYLCERHMVDVLNDIGSTTGTVSWQEILNYMRSLQPRYYSISSSPLPDPNTACVTAAVVRYVTLGRPRNGVTTSFLQDRLEVNQLCPVFISINPEFRLPSNQALPVIMVGPGTGIAPFRAFLQERVLAKQKGQAVGQSLLYFGCRHQDQDFVYKEELESLSREGHVELRVAFSRDQPDKVYVQHLLAQDSTRVWTLIDKKDAHIYICGDAKRMAHDVHKTLLGIVQSESGKSKSEAEQYLGHLEDHGRYQKDVWVT